MKEGLCLLINDSERIQYHSIKASSVVIHLQPTAIRKNDIWSYIIYYQNIKPQLLSITSLKY